MKNLSCEQVLSACSDGTCTQFKNAHNSVTFSCKGKGKELAITPSWPEKATAMNVEQFRRTHHSHEFIKTDAEAATKESKKA